MSEVDVADKVLRYRNTGECDDAKLAKLCDEMPGAPRYTVARAFMSAKKKAPKKKAPAKKKAAKKK